MPITVAISTARRAWGWTRRATFRRELPESWKEVSATRRRRWLSWWLESPADAPERIARDALRLPGWAWRAMGSAEKSALLEKFAWTEPKPDCENVWFSSFRWKRRTYYFPTPKGENMTAIEYACAEDYYKALDGGDERSLLLLAATFWRERERDADAGLRRGDERVPLYDKAEVEARADRLANAPAEVTMQALLYFAGLKLYVHRVYRTWLFEDSDGEDDDEEADGSESPRRSQASDTDGPDFGWWGTFQYVAEMRVFGNVREVYQTPFHEVCVFLVRKRMEADRLRSAGNFSPQKQRDDDDI